MKPDASLFSEHVWIARSPVEVLLRGHLWVEHMLDRLLTGQFIRPQALDLERLTWRHKLALCEALGLVDVDMARGLEEINRLRNRLAHDLSGAPGTEQVRRLVALSPRALQGAIVELRANDDDPERASEEPYIVDLRYWFFAAVMMLDFEVVRVLVEL